MHTLFLCCRYLRKRRIAFFGVLSVALCVALLIVTTSLFSGFIRSYLDHAQRLLGQIVLYPAEPIAEYDELAEYLETLPSVHHAQPVLRSGALLFLGRRDVRAVEIIGIDLARQSREAFFRRSLLLQGTADAMPNFTLSPAARQAGSQWLQDRLGRPARDGELPVGAVLGIGILAEPDERTDEYDKTAIARQLAERRRPMVLTVGRLTDRPDEPAERITRTCWPVDVIQTGMHEADTRYVYLPIEFVASLIGQTDEQGRTRSSGVVQITAAAGGEPAAAAAAVREAWKRFAVERLGWSAERAAFGAVYISAESPNVKSFTREIRKQRVIIVLILGLIGLVAALLIFVVLFMIVLQKRREIGVLRSLGTSRRGVAALFLAFGAGIGILGAAAGLALGIWATRNIRLIEAALMKIFGFKIWKSGVYFFNEIPNRVDFAWAAVIVLVGIAMAVLGSLLPALRACRIQPVDALRYE